MKELFLYEDRLIAFIDILGFEALVMSIDKHPDLHKNLQYALNYFKSYKTPNLFATEKRHQKIEVSVFSDSIVLSTYTENLWGLIWSAGWLQANLLGTGILTRGGITIGKTFHEDDILYGEGMIKAYKIESRAAVYPRIVLDPKIMQKADDRFRYYFLKKDSDSLCYINPFSFNATVGDATELASDGYDPHELYLIELGNHINKGVLEAKEVDHASKWTWLNRLYMEEKLVYLKTRRTKLDELFEKTEGELRKY